MRALPIAVLRTVLVACATSGCILDRDGRSTDAVPGGVAVGNCIVDGAEGCDDCNAVAGDGCDSTGQIEPGHVCPAEGEPCERISGLLTSFVGLTFEVGDPGATPRFEEVCPNDALLVGIQVSDSGDFAEGGQFLTSVAPLCAVASVGDVGQYGWDDATEGTAHAGAGIQNAARYEPLLCAKDQFAVGFRGWRDNTPAHLTMLSLICSAMFFDGTEIKMTGAATDVGPTGSGVGDASGRVRCEAGQFAAALNMGSAADVVLDLIAFQCASVTYTTQ